MYRCYALCVLIMKIRVFSHKYSSLVLLFVEGVCAETLD